MSRRKVAIIKGPYFNEWEYQNFRALQDDFDICYILSKKGHFKKAADDLTHRQIPALSDVYRHLPASLQKLTMVGSNRFLGVDNYLFGLKSALRGQDIVHVTDVGGIFTWQAVQLKRRLGFRLVTTCYENIPFHNRTSLLTSRIQKAAIRNIDRFHAVTERAREVLLLHGVAEERIFVQPFGIDIARFTAGEKKPSLLAQIWPGKSPGKIILFVGQLIRQKGVYPLLFAFHHLLQQSGSAAKVKLLMIGEGSEGKRLRHLATRLGISEHVRFMGSIDYHQLPDYYRLADVFVLPSIPRDVWQEQFGFVLVEAMASGVPVVASLSGSIPEVVGDAGLLVQSYDHLALAQGITGLLQNDAARQTLARKGRQRAEAHFSHKKVGQNLKKLFEI
jgi:starch synthase